MPPLETKSFSISTTITAVFFGLMAIGSGFASTVTTLPVAADESACSPPRDATMSDVMRIAFAIGLFMVVLLSVVDHSDTRWTEVQRETRSATQLLERKGAIEAEGNASSWARCIAWLDAYVGNHTL